MAKDYLFTSERLGFRPWRDADLDAFIAMNQNPQVMRFMPKLLNATESEKLYHRIQNHQKEKGYCYYAVDLLKSGQWIGFLGFQDVRFEAEFAPATEIGYRLLPELWNQGLATEGSLACLAYASDQLKIESIISFTAKINVPSQRVMQKMGLTFDGEFNHPLVDPHSPLYKHVLYKLH